MINRFELEGVTWLDLESPTAEEAQGVLREFELNSELEAEILSPTLKPRVHLFETHAYAVLHFPAMRRTRDARTSDEIDVILGKNFLITVRYAPVEALHEFARAFEARILRGAKKGEKLHAGHLFFSLAEHLHRQAESELDALESAVEKIETEIFAGKEREMVTAISKAAREILTHKRILSAHALTLETFERAVCSLFGDTFEEYFRGAETLHSRVLERSFTMADILEELRETNMGLLYTRQNEVMKNLTIMAFVTFPLSLIAGIFGMNTDFIPVVGHPYDFWIILSGMVILTVLFFVYFKVKKWF
jgi:magnesium transporter